MNKIKVLLFNNNLREEYEQILIQNNFEVFSPGDPKVMLNWSKPGIDIIIAEMPIPDCVSFTEQLRAAGYEGLVFIILDHSTIDHKFSVDCKTHHITGVFRLNTSPEKIVEGINKTLKVLENPVYLSLSLN